jgi:phospholipid/cholesterol/gamma-HCH transport system substrate-binding protein
MAENKLEIMTGAGVLVMAAGFLAYAMSVTGYSAGTDSYQLTASFRSVEGIKIGTDVKLAGVKIGSVTGVSLNPETFRADAEFSVAGGIEIPDDSAISIASEGLLGGNFVEILPGGSPFNLDPNSEIEDTQGSISLISLLSKFVTGSAE